MRYGSVAAVFVPIVDKPKYAFIVFHSVECVFFVLHGESEVKLIINGKHALAKEYIPKSRAVNSDKTE